MKLNDGFITHDTGCEQIMAGTSAVQFAGLVRSNRTAAFIVDCLKTETTESRIVEKMAARFDAPRDVIAADVARIVDTLRGIGAIDE